MQAGIVSSFSTVADFFLAFSQAHSNINGTYDLPHRLPLLLTVLFLFCQSSTADQGKKHPTPKSTLSYTFTRHSQHAASPFSQDRMTQGTATSSVPW
jgi:hypothetical protein